MILVDRIAQGIGLYERFRIFPVVIIGTSEQDTDVQIDVDKICGNQFAIDHYSGRDKHFAAPIGHPFVGVITMIWVVERAPATQEYSALPDFLVPGKGLIEEVED